MVKEISEREFGLKVKIRWENSEKDKKFEVYDFPISYEKAKKILGVRPRIDLRTGIRIELKRRIKMSREMGNYSQNSGLLSS